MSWLSILAIESVVLLFIVLGALVFLGWQRKKRLSRELEQLIDVAQTSMHDRKSWLSQYLQAKYLLKEER